MNQSIGSKIKNLRKEKNLTQEQLCDDFMGRTLLSKIENNKLNPSIKQLEHIARKLKIPVSYLINNGELQSLDESYHTEDSMLTNMFNSHDYHGIIKYVEFQNNKDDTQINRKHIYYYLGMSYFNLEFINPAIKQLRKYITLYLKDLEINKKNDVINFANALNTLFKIMLKNNNYSKGAHYLEMAVKHLSKYDSEGTLINFIVNGNLGYAYISTNKYNEAISLLENCLRINDNLVYLKVIPNLHNCLSIAYYNTGNYNKAIEHVKKCIFFYFYIGLTNQAYACYINYLNALRYSKAFTKAFEVLNSVKQEVKDNFQLCQRFLMQEIIINFDLQNYGYIYSLMDSIVIKNLRKSSLMDYYFIKGHVEFTRKNYREAVKCYKKCEKYFYDNKFHDDLSLMYEDLYVITSDEKYLLLKRNLIYEVNRRNILL